MEDWVQQVILTVYRAGIMGPNPLEFMESFWGPFLGPLGVLWGPFGGQLMGSIGDFTWESSSTEQAQWFITFLK